jgi:hypothetical protein
MSCSSDAEVAHGVTYGQHSGLIIKGPRFGSLISRPSGPVGRSHRLTPYPGHKHDQADLALGSEASFANRFGPGRYSIVSSQCCFCHLRTDAIA